MIEWKSFGDEWDLNHVTLGFGTSTTVASQSVASDEGDVKVI